MDQLADTAWSWLGWEGLKEEGMLECLCAVAEEGLMKPAPP